MTHPSFTVLCLLLTTIAFGQEATVTDENVTAGQEAPRLYLVNDVEIIMKDGQRLILLAGTAIERVNGHEEANQTHILVLGEELSIPSEQVTRRENVERQFRIRALIPIPKSMRPWGRFLLEEERYREASEVWKNIADRSGSTPKDLYLWLMSCIQSEQWEAAQQPLGKIMELKAGPKENQPPLVGVSWDHLQALQGLCHLRNGRPKLAIRDLRDVIETQPKILSYQILLFETYLSLNRYEEAVGLERQIANLSGADPMIMSQLNQKVWTLCDLIVNKLDVSQKSLLQHSQFPLLLSDRETTTTEQAELGVEALLALNQNQAANEFLARARQKFSDSRELNFLAGVSAAIQGDFRRAVSEFDLVIDQYPNHEQAYQHRASIYYQNREYEKSRQDYHTILRLNPENVNAWYSVALCQLRVGQTGEAITVLEMITETYPNDYRPWNLLSWTYSTYPEASFRNGDMAILCALRANELTNFSNAEFLDSLAAAYAEAGRYDDAISTQIDAIDKLPNTPNRAGFLERLEMYRHNEPFREDPRHGDFR
jgi:tetratricopeptide (TPR) repeat protein